MYDKLAKHYPCFMPRELANAYYELMWVVDHVLEQCDVQYSVIGGTLIGAIRHKGLIPWDDDLDCMIWDRDVDKVLQHEVIQMFNSHGYNVGIHRKKTRCIMIYKYPGMELSNHPHHDMDAIKRQKNAFICDLFPHGYRKQEGPGMIRPCGFSGYGNINTLLREDEILPIKRVVFGTYTVNAFDKSEQYLKRYFNDENVLIQPKITHVHNGPAVTQAAKQRIKDGVEHITNLVVPCSFIPPIKS